MVEQRAYLRIREGAFTYLLAADQAVSIERRHGSAFEAADDADPNIVAWSRSGGGRTPVVRLGALMETAAGEWEYAILLSDGADRVGMAAEHIYLIPESGAPVIQPFNPPGNRVPGGQVITGLCPDTEPDYLVLDQGRLQRSLRRVSGREGE